MKKLLIFIFAVSLVRCGKIVKEENIQPIKVKYDIEVVKKDSTIIIVPVN